MTDSLRVWWKLPELSERLTMLVIIGTKSAEHSLRSQVGIGSESHCLLGQLNKNDVIEARSNVHIDEPLRSTANILKSLSYDR